MAKHNTAWMYMKRQRDDQPCTGQPTLGQMAAVKALWMPRPEGITRVPPGLEYLCEIEQLVVQQQLGAFNSWETTVKYIVKNAKGEHVYFAAEGPWDRKCCGPSRGFTVHFTDSLGQEVIRVNRNFKWCAGCQCCAVFDCCSLEVEIKAPIGQVCSYVKQVFSCCAPRYDILDANRERVLTIEGPGGTCTAPCCTMEPGGQPGTWRIIDDLGKQVGKIRNQWSGFTKDVITTAADYYGVKFRKDLNVRIKAACIGAVFLICQLDK